SFSFDACIFELMMALCCGASLALPPCGSVLAGATLIQTVNRYGISHATLPPAVLTALPRNAALSSLRPLVVAGEAVTRSLVEDWARGRRMINAYGPTEITVWATGHDCSSDESGAPPIGRPITNKRIYILDGHGRTSPTWVAGEIYIGGVGVARGYLDRREM